MRAFACVLGIVWMTWGSSAHAQCTAGAALSSLPQPALETGGAADTIARAAAIEAMPVSEAGRPTELLRLADAYRATGRDPEAIRILAVIVRDHPDWARVDEVLFRLGTTLGRAGQHDRERQVLHRLISHHPTSPLVAAGYLVFADYYFGERDYAVARQFTERALQSPGTFEAYARYRMAWVLAGLGDAGGAQAALDAAQRAGNAAGQVGGADVRRAASTEREALVRFARCSAS